jgi:prolyl-tRNA synthetase
MKDAYSFDRNNQKAEETYLKVFAAYKKVFSRCGLSFVPVEADPGLIGGSFSHEFMVLAQTGEEEIVSCSCGYAANREKAEFKIGEEKEGEKGEKEKNLEEVYTPDLRTVEEVGNFLKLPAEKFIKTLIYVTSKGKPVAVLLRGDHTVNEIKLKKCLGEEANLAEAKVIEEVTGAPLGFAGPVGLEGKIEIIADYGVKAIHNAVSGANKKDYHLININLPRDFSVDKFADLRKAEKGDFCFRCGEELKFSRGIEVGHTFKLGTKYSQALEATFSEEDGQRKYFVMGCYGIGVSRIVGAAIEQYHDEEGIIWPLTIAPYQVIILPLSLKDERQKKVGEEIYQDFLNEGIEVLLDDRDERAGVKFKDADLIGIPIRITVSERGLREDKVELKLRQEKKGSFVSLEEVKEEVLKIIKKGRI